MFLERMYAEGFESYETLKLRNNHMQCPEFRFKMQLFDLKNQYLLVLSCKYKWNHMEKWSAYNQFQCREYHKL